MPLPARPHLIVILRVARSSLVVRKFAPIGKSSSSRSPSANGPWQSAHPVVFHIAKPAFTFSLFCANAAVEYAGSATTKARITPLAPNASFRSPIYIVFNSVPTPVSNDCQSRTSPHAASFRIKLIVVITPIRLVSVIKQTFLLGNFSLSNYARLKIGHHVVDLLPTELGRGWIKVPAASRTPACALLECRHSGARASATDCELELLRIEPCPSQISSSWRFIALLFAVRKGTMTFRTPAIPPRSHPCFHFVFVLRKCGGRAHQSDGGNHHDDGPGTGSILLTRT